MRRFAFLALVAIALSLPALAQEKEKGANPPELEALIEKIRNGTPDEREKALKQLLDWSAPNRGVLSLLVEGGAGSEQMSGTWTEQGKVGQFRLESLGDGRYRLSADAKTGDEHTDISDDGTMAELRQRHAFLRGLMMLGVRTLPSTLGVRAVLVDVERVSRTGLEVRRPSEELRYHLALPEGAGLLVDRVEKDSLAEKLGLERFDVIVKVGGELVTKAAQLEGIDQGPVEILRRAQPRTLGK